MKKVRVFEIRTFIPIIFSCLLFFLISPLYAGEDTKLHDRQKEGLKLVETFYEFLVSDARLADCPDIFTNCLSDKGDEKERQKSLILEWKYLRGNLRLFVTDVDKPRSKPSDYIKEARVIYCFFNPPDVDHYTDGDLSIVLFITTFPGSYGGIYKLVAFPIDFDEQKGVYQIDLSGININGILIDIDYGKGSEKFIRDFDLFERLGFEIDKNVKAKYYNPRKWWNK